MDKLLDSQEALDSQDTFDLNKLTILIDAREASLYAEISERDLDIYSDKIDIIKKNIDLGDIHIKYKDIYYIFERKTVPDLQSSIQDGRYREQKARMLSSCSQKNISYIIEGDDILSSRIYSKNKSMIQGAYLHTMFRDNIRILFTNNTCDTATLLLSICIKILDNPKKFSSENYNSESVYTDCIKLKKKKIENIDANTCYIMQLSQIPHISNVIAKNIAKVYPNMIDLISKINSVDSKDKNKELCKIDGVGKEKAATILKYLFNSE